MLAYIACRWDQQEPHPCEHCGTIDPDHLSAYVEIPWSDDAVASCRQWNNPTWVVQALEGQTMLTCHVAFQCVPDVLVACGFARSPVDRAVVPWIREQRTVQHRVQIMRDLRAHPPLDAFRHPTSPRAAEIFSALMATAHVSQTCLRAWTIIAQRNGESWRTVFTHTLDTRIAFWYNFLIRRFRVICCPPSPRGSIEFTLAQRS